jgi:hypothetical protein
VSIRKQAESDESFVIQGRRPDSGGAANVDERKPRQIQSRQAALSERSDRRGMGVCRAFKSPGPNMSAASEKSVCARSDLVRAERQWYYVPKDLQLKSTLYDYFDLSTYDATLENIHHALYVKCREQIGRESSPTACVIDSQSLKSAEKGGLDRSGWLRCG